MPMNFSITDILQQYFKTSSLQETSVEDIETLADKYPYLATLQFLLAKKYKQLQDADFRKQAAKTTLYFNNPYWFYLLLEDKSGEPGIANGTITHEATDSITEKEKAVATEDPQAEKADIAVVSVAEQTIPEEKDTIADVIASLKENLHAVQEPHHAQEDTESRSTGQSAGKDPDAASELIASLQESLKAANAENQPVADPEVLPQENAIAWQQVAEEEPAPQMQEQHDHEQPLTGTEEYTSATEADPGNILAEQLSAENKPNEDDGAIDETPDAPKEVTGSLEGKMKLSDIWKQPVSATEEDIIPVEPLYTIDYFASQGIKLGTMDGAQDKLSVKLKSFTEWLKTMKRIHPEKLESSSEQAQTVIQHMAENSNKTEGIVTEAIAEVFARQGLKHKAIEVYEKLSLQNPDKNAYFAAKISKLNET